MKLDNFLVGLLVFLLVGIIAGIVIGLSINQKIEYDVGYYYGQLDAAKMDWMSIKQFQDFKGKIPKWLKQEH